MFLRGCSGNRAFGFRAPLPYFYDMKTAYFLFYKPFGVLPTFTDGEGRPTLKDFVPVPGIPPRPVPVRPYHPKTWLKVVLREGRKRQLRRMTAAVGFPTLRLVRVAIGPLTLGRLQPGQWRILTLPAIRRLKAELALPNETHHRRPRTI